MTAKKALSWAVFWVIMALCFNAGVYFFLGKEKALEFLGGYVLEQSLSIDNLFLFVLIFSSFGISQKSQRRVLNYGILGAMVLRLMFIELGAAVINMFHSVMYFFGVILVISGLKMSFDDREEPLDLKNNRIFGLLGKIIPVTDTFKGSKFFIRKRGRLYATPLFAILVLIESTDIIFAIDSIPAIFSITTDVFIVYSSNIFAIIGLRSMYFVLEKLRERFRLVRYGVAFILIFTGVKLLAMMFDIAIPVGFSLAVIFSVLLLSILLSLIFSGAKAV